MQMPFEKLVELVEAETDPDITLGQLAEKYGEPVGRITDAITAGRMLRGERTYIEAPMSDHPVRPVNDVCSLCWHGDGDPRCLRCGLSIGGWDVCTCGDLREIGPCVQEVTNRLNEGG